MTDPYVIQDFIGNAEMPVNMKNKAQRALEALIAERDDAWAQHGSITQHRDALASECHRLTAENDALRQQLDGHAKETGDLRQAVTEAAGMPWIPHPQPTGSVGYVCPDDVDIAKFVAGLRQQLAERDEWEAVPDEVRDTIDAALHSLRASDTIWMNGNQIERIDTALAWLNGQQQGATTDAE